MRLDGTVLGLVAVFLGFGNAAPTWPAAIDELEDVMFLSTGYKSRGLSSHVTPCGFSEFGAGRSTAAEWLRLGFHDMANGNAHMEPRGGIDASIAFELNNGDNVGTGFASSLIMFAGYLNSRLSVADVIALGVYTSVRACGGPSVAMRGGRIDATEEGPIGVPAVTDGTVVFKSRFARMGFTPTEMIQVVACGHTIGGVHRANFADLSPSADYTLFDTTQTFDTLLITRYLGINGQPDTNPLTVGPVPGKRSDRAVYLTDNNSTISTLSDIAVFRPVCATVLQKMIELVPTDVTLSDIIEPYEVKPSGLQLTLLAGGTQIKFSGEIRVRTTSRQVASVQIVYKNRSGGTGGTITTSSVGSSAGFDDTFQFYAFNSNLLASTSISSFTVVVTTTGGTTTTFNNNGAGFPIQDSVIVQTPQSCLSGGTLTIVAAVRTGVTAPTLEVIQKTARANNIQLPTLVKASVAATKGATYGSYSLYSATFTIASGAATEFGVSSGTFSDTFKKAASLAAVCAPFGTTPSSSTTTTTSAASASASPVLSHKPVIGAYTFQGCWTEISGGRALNAASFFSFEAMTLEFCATSCASFTYFGVEYGGECYCGNTLNVASTKALDAECSFLCPGNPLQYCGAGNRMELYKKTSQLSSSSAVPSTSATTTSTPTISSTSSLVTSTTTQLSTLTTSVRSSSTTSSSSVPTLRIVPSVGLYNYHGCFTETTGTRALAAAFYPSDTLTVEQCVASCSAYKFAGAEYGRECFCADTFTTGSIPVPNSDCSMTCAGNQYEYCGAGNRLTVYIKNGTAGGVSSNSASTSLSTSSLTTLVASQSSSLTSSFTTQTTTVSPSSSQATTTSVSPTPTPTGPVIKPTIGAYKYHGCRTEATNFVRALSSASLYNYTSMTLSMCASNCAGFKYWGTEYGGECFCGNTWNTGSIIVADGDCNMVCPGDEDEFCGSGNRLSSYELIET